jgi:hypothetical protein
MKISMVIGKFVTCVKALARRLGPFVEVASGAAISLSQAVQIKPTIDMTTIGHRALMGDLAWKRLWYTGTV